MLLPSVKLEISPVLSKEFLDIQATIESRFTLKHVCDMIITCGQMYHTDKYSKHSSIIWPVFIYELSGCGFKPHCRHIYAK